jgi:beta-glucosidase
VTSEQLSEHEVPTVDELTTDEALRLVVGHGMWRTAAVHRVGIPSVVMADGPNGLRFSREQSAPEGGADFADFIGLVTRRGECAAPARGPEPATCFPTASNVGTTWDVMLAERLGAAFAAECRSFGVGLLLGPGMNIRRTPMAGRTSEYYSEDPLHTGDMAGAFVRGIQGAGVGACIKHFAANNSEIDRTSMDSVVDERALRDIYLRGFERVVRRDAPWAVMSSYNRLGGLQTAQHPWLLTEVLRDEWGYDGLVVSDWHGITDPGAAVRAGNNLDMPQSVQRSDRLRQAVEAGEVGEAELHQAAARVRQLAQRAARPAGEPLPAFDADAHHALAQQIAGEGTVLLRNDGVLPLDAAAGERILVLGEGAVEPVIQGFGSARMRPTRVDVPLTEIQARAGGSVRHLAGAPSAAEREAAVAAAADADVVVVFAHTSQNSDGENADRRDLHLSEGYDALIAAVAPVARRTVVVLTVPDAVLMPWLDDVDAVLVPFYAGQGMGGAVARLLFGEESPSGKLTTTFPRRAEDLPSFLGYPGEGGKHVYVDGPFVGYRGFDVRDVDPLFPFGHGLSYTRFEMLSLTADGEAIARGGQVELRVEVRNAGDRAGAEVVQVYASAKSPRARRAPRELVGFAKVALEPGESRTVRIVVEGDDLAHWDAWRGQRVLDDGAVTLHVGSSSRDLPLSVTLGAHEPVPRWRPLARDTAPGVALKNPHARAAVADFLRAKLDVDATQADELVEQGRLSFVNVFDTLANRFRFTFTEAEAQAAIAAAAAGEAAEISAAMGVVAG